MPRYFFHTADGHADVDLTGTDLRDDHAARMEAIRYGGEVLRDEPDVLWNGRDFRVEVTDDAGKLMFTIVMLAVDATRSTVVAAD